MPPSGQAPDARSCLALENIDEFKALRADWTRLWEMTHLSFFSSWEWSWTWWQVYSDSLPKSARLKIFVYRASAQGEVLAILPTYEVRGRLGIHKKLSLLGIGEPFEASVYTEFLDLICPSCTPHIRTWATEIFRRYDQISFGIVRADSTFLSILNSAELEGFELRFVTMPTYRADLSEGFDHYLSQLSRNTRYQARKIIKQLNDNSMKLASPATHEERLVWFNRLIVLHQHRWTERGLAGAFSDERITRFHTLIFSLAHQVCIYRLAHSGIDIGYIYGFLTADRFDWYQMGIEFAGSNLQRPGYALHLATIRTLSTTTATRYYEFLAGANQLKTQLGPLREEAMNVELYKCTLPHRLKTTISAILLRSRKLLSR